MAFSSHPKLVAILEDILLSSSFIVYTPKVLGDLAFFF